MIKSELLKALEPYDDDQYVYVSLRSRESPAGVILAIQGVCAVDPWHKRMKQLVGLLADADNAEIGDGQHKPVFFEGGFVFPIDGCTPSGD